MTFEEAFEWLDLCKDCQLDEAIESERMGQYKCAKSCREEADNFVQLKEWLEELKRLREEKRPTGKWIDHYYPYFEVPGIECSECGKDVDYWTSNYDYPKYCPNCGTPMKGGEE